MKVIKEEPPSWELDIGPEVLQPTDMHYMICSPKREPFNEDTCRKYEEEELQSSTTQHVDTEPHPNIGPHVDKQPLVLLQKIKIYSCPTCQQFFLDFEKLSTHNCSNGRLKREVVQCESCAAEFTLKCNLQKHILRFHMNKSVNYICDTCNKKFSSKHNLKAHMSQHNNSTHKCKYCNKIFQCDTYRKRHTDRIHLHLYQMCHICKHSIVKRHFYQHRQKCKVQSYKHKQKCTEQTYYKLCVQCNRHFADLRSHQRRVHIGESHRTCYICNIVYNSRATLNKHNRNKHLVSSDNSASVIQNLKQKECAKYSKNQTITCRKQGTFQCNRCYKSYSTLKAVKNHSANTCIEDTNNTISMHATLNNSSKNNATCNNIMYCKQNGKFECKKCHKIFSTMKMLKRHLEISCQGVCGCCVCEQLFKCNLEEHIINKHSKQLANKLPLNYVCDYCTTMFHKKKTLVTHIYSHCKKNHSL